MLSCSVQSGTAALMTMTTTTTTMPWKTTVMAAARGLIHEGSSRHFHDRRCCHYHCSHCCPGGYLPHLQNFRQTIRPALTIGPRLGCVGTVPGPRPATTKKAAKAVRTAKRKRPVLLHGVAFECEGKGLLCRPVRSSVCRRSSCRWPMLTRVLNICPGTRNIRCVAAAAVGTGLDNLRATAVLLRPAVDKLFGVILASHVRSWRR